VLQKAPDLEIDAGGRGGRGHGALTKKTSALAGSCAAASRMHTRKRRMHGHQRRAHAYVPNAE
jgi:hypothetical protein